MVALDIRQESTRHTDALDAITTHLGIGSYKCALQRAAALCFQSCTHVAVKGGWRKIERRV